MAYNLETTSSTGIPVTYWKISQTNLNYIARVAEVHLLAYYSKEAREANGSAYIERKVVRVKEDDFDKIFSADVLKPEGKEPRLMLYEHIKATEDFFATAVDLM